MADMRKFLLLVFYHIASYQFDQLLPTRPLERLLGGLFRNDQEEAGFHWYVVYDTKMTWMTPYWPSNWIQSKQTIDMHPYNIW